MALNGANAVSDALELGWLAIGSLALGVAQLAVMVDESPATAGVWAKLAEISPPLQADRPMAAEVRAARDLMAAYAAELLTDNEDEAVTR
jgi:histidine ammonia-lyase